MYLRQITSLIAKDVCFGEESRLSCGRGEVIMMTSAEYVHMDGGHCIDEVDARYRGCADDVLQVFDKWCSGKQECTFDTRSKELKNVHINCPKFIVRYARLHHKCIKGTIIHNLLLLSKLILIKCRVKVTHLLYYKLCRYIKIFNAFLKVFKCLFYKILMKMLANS